MTLSVRIGLSLFSSIGTYSDVTLLFPSDIKRAALADCVPAKNSSPRFSPLAFTVMTPLVASAVKPSTGISMNSTELRVSVWTAFTLTASSQTFSRSATTSFGEIRNSISAMPLSCPSMRRTSILPSSYRGMYETDCMRLSSAVISSAMPSTFSSSSDRRSSIASIRAVSVCTSESIRLFTLWICWAILVSITPLFVSMAVEMAC